MSSPHLSDGVGDVLIDGVGDLGPLHACLELHGQHAGVVPQPPVVGLVPSQARAVDPGLLPRADPDDLEQRGTQHRDQNHSCLPDKPLRKGLPQFSCSSLMQLTSVGN